VRTYNHGASIGVLLIRNEKKEIHMATTTKDKTPAIVDRFILFIVIIAALFILAGLARTAGTGTIAQHDAVRAASVINE
jgi:hypothetical protein